MVGKGGRVPGEFKQFAKIASREVGERVAQKQERHAAHRQAEHDARYAPDPATRQGAQEWLAEEAAAQHEKTKRTAMRLGTVGVTGLAVAAGIAYATGKIGQEVKAAVPHSVTKQEVQATLNHVKLENNTTILAGIGKAAARQDIAMQSCLPVIGCHNILGGGGHVVGGYKKGMEVDVVNQPGTVSLTAERGEKPASKWHVLATVNANKLNTKPDTSNAVPIKQEPSDGFIVKLGQVFGANTHKHTRELRMDQLAKNNFQSACGPILKPGIPEAEASYIETELNQTAGALKQASPDGYQTLKELAGQPIHLRFVQPSKGQAETDAAAISPSDIDLSLPSFTSSRHYTESGRHSTHAEITLTASDKSCKLSPESSDTLHKFEDAHDFVVETGQEH
jgi:hypothetical protein